MNPLTRTAAATMLAAFSPIAALAQQPETGQPEPPPNASQRPAQGAEPQEPDTDRPVWAERLIVTLKEASKTRQELTEQAQQDLSTVRSAADALSTLSKKDGKPTAQELDTATAALAKVLDAIERLQSQEPQFQGLYGGVLDSVRDALLKARSDGGGGIVPDAAGQQGMQRRLVLAAGLATDDSVPARWRQTFEQIFGQLHQEAEAYGVGPQTNALKSRIQAQTLRILESLQSRVYQSLLRDRLRFSRLGRQHKAYENVRLLLQTVGSFGGLEAEMQRLLEELPAEFLPDGADGSTFDRWVEELLGRLEGEAGSARGDAPAPRDRQAALARYAELYREQQAGDARPPAQVTNEPGQD